MASKPRNYPFYNWVPKGVGILILFFLFFPILTAGGVYTANSGEMTSGLGILSEHITFANYCTSIGMAAFAPLFYRLMLIRRPKMMCLPGFIVMYILSYVCAKTDSMLVLGLCSIILGFLRMMLMLVVLFALIKYAGKVEACEKLTPGNEPTTATDWDELDRTRAIANTGIYLFFMLMGQCGTALTAWLAYEYHWQDVYYYMMGMSLVAILLIFITMPYRGYRGLPRFPISMRMFGNVTTLCLSLACFSYVMVYGKTLDWFDDSTIRWATVGCIFFMALLFYMDHVTHRRSHYLLLGVFKQKNILMASLLYALLMALNCSAMFVSLFTNVGMKLDNWQSASLNNWTMMGYFIGAVICIILSLKKVHFKRLFIIGFLFIGLSALYMYFEVQSMGLYERMKYPVILRSIGMMIPYCLIAVLATRRMPYKYFSTWICVMLTFRMVIGPGIGAAVYGVTFQERQQYYIERYAANVDRMNTEATASYDRTAMGMRYQGKNETEAQQMAAISTKGRIQVQASLSAVKEMAGWTIYACIGAIVLVLLLPIGKQAGGKATNLSAI